MFRQYKGASIACIVAGCFLSVTAEAKSPDWIKMGENKGLDVYYVDKNNVKKVGNLAYIWVLADLHTPIQKRIFSSKSYKEIDCSSNTEKDLQMIFFSGQMNEGDILGINDEPTEKEIIVPGSPGDKVKDYVCANV